MYNNLIDVIRIYRSGFFDKQVYRQQVKSILASLFPIIHFCFYGWKKGLNPSREFNVSYYLDTYLDVKSAKINPFIHWITHGEKEGRITNKYDVFNADEYCQLYPDVSVSNALTDYYNRLKKGEVVFPNFYKYDYFTIKTEKWFDKSYYINQNPHLAKEEIDALRHFITVGWLEGKSPSKQFNVMGYQKAIPSSLLSKPISECLSDCIETEYYYSTPEFDREIISQSGLFDKNYYTQKYSKELPLNIEPLTHFCSLGWKEGKNPSEVFETNTYLELYPNVVGLKINPLVHYIKSGRIKGKAKNYQEYECNLLKEFGLFDVDYYLTSNADVAKSGIDPVHHFYSLGWKEGRNPSPQFDIKAYSEQYQNEDKSINPLIDFIINILRIEYGNKKANRTVDVEEILFDSAYYLNENPDVKREGINPVKHFFISGWKEGRNPNKLFNTKFYLSLNQDIENKPINPFLHYIIFGRKEERAFRKTVEINPLKKALENTNLPQRLTDTVSIIVPVYNGYDYLKSLFPQLAKNTNGNYKLIVVNDFSPDERIIPFIQSQASNFENIKIITNSENLGFVKSVNVGIQESEGHVIIVNSDTALPLNWLERLLTPIYTNPKIASVTPMTNAGTLASFPNILEDNPVFLDMNVDEIDSVFSKYSADTVFECPTGVGFCMAMSRLALDKIGGFDEEVFIRGYGEENDWCCRAIEAGYINVVQPGLFVWHKHGGSFTSEEKNTLIKTNTKALLKKHPSYMDNVRKHLTKDSLAPFRLKSFIDLCAMHSNREVLIAINHKLGGGASLYLQKKLESAKQTQPIILLSYNYTFNCYELEISYKTEKLTQFFSEISDIFQFFSLLDVEELFYNNLVSFPKPLEVLQEISTLIKEKSIKLIITIHDYFPVCQSFTLLDDKNNYCGASTDLKTCTNCIKNNTNYTYKDIPITTWRNQWAALFDDASKIICFSNSSKKIIQKVFTEIKSDIIEVIPHTLPTPIETKPHLSTNNELHVGVLGTINTHKGALVVKSIVDYFVAKNYGRITIIGSLHDIEINSTRFNQTGNYNQQNLPELIQKSGINVFLFPSVWPETFSYVTDELIAMDVPVVAYNIGAPAERISNYKNGVLVDINSSINSIVETLETLKDKSITHYTEILIKKIKDSQLFDTNYYLASNPDIKEAGIDPYIHYLFHGGIKGRNPSDSFDSAYYLSENPDVKNAGMNPLLHYIDFGKEEGRLPKYGNKFNLFLPNIKINKALKIAVVVHAYYEDLVEELLDYTKNIPIEYTILLSVVSQQGKDIAVLWASKNNFNNIKIKIVENRGRDIAPAFISFRDEIKEHDLICKIHSKKSLYTGAEQTGWRKQLVSNLLKDELVVSNIINMFQTDSKTGIVYPISYLLPYWAYTWLSNKNIAFELQSKLNVPLPTSGYIDYPMGSMFWFRPLALSQLLDETILIEDFKEEPCGNDGTFAHAIERALVYIAHHNGYKHIEVSFLSNTYAKEFGTKNFHQYTSLTQQDLMSKIDNYEIISFDIFDTLISRTVLFPDFVFELLERKLDNEFKRKTNYMKIRKQAESLAREKLKKDVSYSDIYDTMLSENLLDRKIVQIAHNMEFELEIQVTRPREAMIEALNYAVGKDKEIWLVSDMYLEESQIGKLLKKNKIIGYNKLYLSNALNKRKDTGVLWDYLLKEKISNPNSFMHIGDNEHSDIQQTVDRGLGYFHLMSPYAMFCNSTIGLNYTKQFHDWRKHAFMRPAINQFFANPFIGNRSEKIDPILSSPFDTGYCVFGPIILAYFNWICSNAKTENIRSFYFLAREGYLLKEMYDFFITLDGVKKHFGNLPKSYYLLTSRRSVMGAVEKNKELLIQIITNNEFEGTFGDLLYNRLGVDISKENNASSEVFIRLPQDKNLVIELVDSYTELIEKNSKKEREAMLHYLNSVDFMNDNSKAVLDVGYSGTIQRYLHTISQQPIKGYYFVTRDDTQEWVYEKNNTSGYFENNALKSSETPVFKFNLYLEFWLTSPQGQLKHFRKMAKESIPVYKEKEQTKVLFDINETITKGVMKYLADTIASVGENIEMLNVNEKNAQFMFEQAVRLDLWDNKTRKIAYLEDNFCGKKNEMDIIGDYKKYVL